MTGRVTRITEKVPREVMLEDGIYIGIWGGNCIDVKHEGRIYEMTTEEGVRGIGFTVIVTIKEGMTTFQLVSNK